MIEYVSQEVHTVLILHDYAKLSDYCLMCLML